MILVTGGTGKTGRRVVQRLTARGLPVRIGSRSGEPPFDWHDPRTWEPVLQGVTSAYLVYYPDLADPAAVPAIDAFAKVAVSGGVRRMVLLSGRGEEMVLGAEQALRDSGAEWTILRASWFCQNFSEDFLLEPVLSGEVALPAADVPEPFIDAEDVADAAVTVLTGNGHAGQIYDLSGPRLLTFTEAVTEISKAAGREVHYLPVTSRQYATVLGNSGIPAEWVDLLAGMFTKVLDGRNAHLSDGVPRLLGRPARDFSDYARDAAATRVWG